MYFSETARMSAQLSTMLWTTQVIPSAAKNLRHSIDVTLERGAPTSLTNQHQSRTEKIPRRRATPTSPTSNPTMISMSADGAPKPQPPDSSPPSSVVVVVVPLSVPVVVPVADASTVKHAF